LTESIVDDSFSHHKLIYLEQAADISSQNSSAGYESEVSFGIAFVGFRDKITISCIKFRCFGSLTCEELLKVLNFFFVNIFVVKPVRRAGRQLPFALDLVVDLFLFFTVFWLVFRGFLMMVVYIFRKCIFFGYDWRDL